ncbi:outer membrane protein [Parerythrobacter lacustris]|uniref:Outer membrane beta-barrel protein n=1 Tax=Parerythrobacter lacustris TaxID=2969984 RepID=A0ABT1XNI9_9SPHN|nr:outer membrane beta-barrel protein [Parerythrobacter lacustris]MCR2833224.1 outer membrane beta-barrel protein [Parerythrobacter lacustris]
MKLEFFGSSAAALGMLALATPALAQDANTEGRFDGPYISVFGGSNNAADSDDDGFEFDVDGDGAFDDNVTTVAGANAFSPGFCSGNPGTSPTPVCTGNDSKIGYGARIGYDVRMGDGPFVAGVLIEGERPRVREFTSGYSTTPASYTIARELDWSAAARARVGISPGDGRGLFYATGGVGYAKIERDFFTTNGANSFTPNDPDEWTFGWQAGGGAELLLTDNIGIGLEYLYSNYDDGDYVVTVGPGTAGPTNPFLLGSGTTDLRLNDGDFDSHSLRASVNLRF